MKMETKFEISLEAYTSIVYENAKLKALLERCENLLVEMVSAQVKDWDINRLSPEQCKAAQKMNDDWLIQKYSTNSAVSIVTDNLPCFTVRQVKNALAENIRRKIQDRIEDIDYFNRLKGKLGMLDRKDAERFLRKLKANRHPTLIYENYDGRLIPVKEIARYEETREGKTLVEIKFFLILRDGSWVSCKWTPYGWNRLSVSNYDSKDYPA